MSGAEPRASRRGLLRKLEILTVPCLYILSLLLFIVDNTNNFLTGFIHSFIIRARSICPRCTAALRLTVRPRNPTYVLDVPTFAARCLHVHSMREIQAAKGGTLWARIMSSNFA